MRAKRDKWRKLVTLMMLHERRCRLDYLRMKVNGKTGAFIESIDLSLSVSLTSSTTYRSWRRQTLVSVIRINPIFIHMYARALIRTTRHRRVCVLFDISLVTFSVCVADAIAVSRSVGVRSHANRRHRDRSRIYVYEWFSGICIVWIDFFLLYFSICLIWECRRIRRQQLSSVRVHK